jgi:sporulation protein YlmC with PRC-barrel domain
VSDLGFQVSKETIQVQTALELTLEENVKRTNRATHLQTKQEQINVNLPLIGLMKTWVHHLLGDVLRFVYEQASQQESQILIGIPDEDADAFIGTIESIMEDVDAIGEVVGRKGKVAAKVAELTLRIKTRCSELVEAIEEAALGDGVEGEEEESEEFVINEEPPKKVHEPLIVDERQEVQP